MKLLIGGLLTVAAIAAAQDLTPRQLFYQDSAPAKPAQAAAKTAPKKDSKTAPKAPPKKTAPDKTVIGDPQPESAAPPVVVDSAPRTAPARVINASHSVDERPLGLRYALAQLLNGAEREVSPEATFRAGDQVRVKVEVNRAGYLYVITRGSSGVWKPLFPAPEINGGNNRVEGRRGYRLPSDTQAFVFDEQPGQEQLFVIFSAEPVRDMDSLIPSLRAPEKEPRLGPVITASATPIGDAFVSRLRNTYSRDLVVQTVTPSQPPDPGVGIESAVYVISRTGGRVVADIRMEHK